VILISSRSFYGEIYSSTRFQDNSNVLLKVIYQEALSSLF